MPAGFQSIGDHGSYIITGEEPNLMFWAKGSATNSISFSCPTLPVVFVRGNDARRTVLNRLGNNNYRFDCLGSFSYWIFCPPPQDIAQNFGLQIFNESGTLVYTSVERPLKIVGMYSYTRVAKSTFIAGTGVLTRVAQLNTGPIATVNLGGSNFAFASNIDGAVCTVLRYLQPGGRTMAANDSFEGIRATSTGFEIREYNDTLAGMQLQDDEAFLYGFPTDWVKPPGTIVVADISGL